MQNEEMTINSNAEQALTSESSISNTEEPIAPDEVSKLIQGAEDRLRAKYSKQIKQLESKLAELTPKEKSEAELELEKRSLVLEQNEIEFARKKSELDFIALLDAKGLDRNLAQFLKQDSDLDSFKSALDDVIKNAKKASGFVPFSHQGERMSKKEFSKLSYAEKERLYKENPSLVEPYLRK